MRKRSYPFIIVTCMVILITCFSLGYSINYYRIMKNKEQSLKNRTHPFTEQMDRNNTEEMESTNTEKNEYIEMENGTIAQAITNEENTKVAADATFIFKTKYDGCKHELAETIPVPESLVNFTEDELIRQYPQWQLSEFSRHKVVFFRWIGGKCPQHYIVKEYNGKIGIFYQTPVNGQQIKQIIDVNINNFRQEDRELLQQGIPVESDEELAGIIEDYSS